MKDHHNPTCVLRKEPEFVFEGADDVLDDFPPPSLALADEIAGRLHISPEFWDNQFVVYQTEAVHERDPQFGGDEFSSAGDFHVVPGANGVDVPRHGRIRTNAVLVHQAEEIRLRKIVGRRGIALLNLEHQIIVHHALKRLLEIHLVVLEGIVLENVRVVLMQIVADVKGERLVELSSERLLIEVGWGEFVTSWRYWLEFIAIERSSPRNRRCFGVGRCYFGELQLTVEVLREDACEDEMIKRRFLPGRERPGSSRMM